MDGNNPKKALLIIPCFNEDSRIQGDLITQFILNLGVDTLFVDDGSIDGTVEIINALIINNRKLFNEAGLIVTVLSISKNIGKTNAIRTGLLWGSQEGYSHAIIQDIDFPYLFVDAINALNLGLLTEAHTIISGARVELAGSSVLRTPLRHWIGRIIATFIHVFIVKNIYDPQSPCKVYNLNEVSPFLVSPFRTRWFGDLELIIRIRNENKKYSIVEFPLTYWRDLPGGALSFRSSLKVLLDLYKLVSIKSKSS